MFADLLAFQQKYGLEYNGPPRCLEGELGQFRLTFLDEELTEYRTARDQCLIAISEGDEAETAYQLEQQLDALVDLVYVALGTACFHGFDFPEAWRRVHVKNMQKVRAERTEQSKRGTLFDVVKPKGWTAPDHSDLVEHHAHRNV